MDQSQSSENTEQSSDFVLLTFKQNLKKSDVKKADQMLPDSTLDTKRIKNQYFFIGIALLGLLLMIYYVSTQSYSVLGYQISYCFIIIFLILLIIHLTILMSFSQNKAYFLMKKKVSCLFQLTEYYNKHSSILQEIELYNEFLFVRNYASEDSTEEIDVDLYGQMDSNNINLRYDTIIETKETDDYIVLYWINYGIVLQKKELGQKGINLIYTLVQPSSVTDTHSVMNFELQLDHKDFSDAQELEFCRTHNNIYLLLLSGGVLLLSFCIFIINLQLMSLSLTYYAQLQ